MFILFVGKYALMLRLTARAYIFLVALWLFFRGEASDQREDCTDDRGLLPQVVWSLVLKGPLSLTCGVPMDPPLATLRQDSC